MHGEGREKIDLDQKLHELMDLYGQDVWNLAFSITRSIDFADDVTQDVFLKVYQKYHVFRWESSVKTWLLSITRNQAYDCRRSAFFRRVTLVGSIMDRGNTKSAEEEVLSKSILDQAWQSVLRLPIKYREVLVLQAHHNLSIAEIALVLGIREATVKSRLLRAKARALKLYKESESDGGI